MEWMDPVALQSDKIQPRNEGSVFLYKMTRERKKKGRKKEMELINPVALQSDKIQLCNEGSETLSKMTTE